MQHDDPIDRAAGAVERWLASDPARRVELAELERLWGRAGRLLLGARIDGTWRALVAAGTRAPLAVADVAVEQSLSYGGHYWGIPSVSADGRAVLYGVEDAHHPPDLWIAVVGFADRRRLTAINPELDKYELGSARLSTFAPMMTWRSGRCVAYWTPVLAFFDGPRRPFASAWQLPEGGSWPRVLNWLGTYLNGRRT
jgi:hypothetical protein